MSRVQFEKIRLIDAFQIKARLKKAPEVTAILQSLNHEQCYHRTGIASPKSRNNILLLLFL